MFGFPHSQRAVPAIANCPQVGGFLRAAPDKRPPFPPTVRKSHLALELFLFPYRAPVASPRFVLSAYLAPLSGSFPEIQPCLVVPVWPPIHGLALGLLLLVASSRQLRFGVAHNVRRPPDSAMRIR